MEAVIQDYFNSLCCYVNKCTSAFATNLIKSIADVELVKAFPLQTTCDDADTDIISIGDVYLGSIYSASINGASVELKTIGDVSLGFGY